ncbi:B12-binding domain-containing radical SAM protein [Methanoregula sp.]
MKILIIITRFAKGAYTYDKNSTEKNYTYMVPLGLPYISAFLKKNGYDVTILNLNHLEGKVQDLIRDELSKNQYNIIFTGGVSIYFPDLRDYVQYIREDSPDSKIVIGGGIISAQPEIMYSLLKPDFIVIGEGELTALELMQCIEKNGDPSKVDGIGYTENGNLVLTKPRKPIIDLDALPYPDLEGMGFDEFLDHTLPTFIVYDTVDFPRPYPLLASRSCPFACTFCFHTIGNKYRQRSIKSIIDEIKYAVRKYKVNIIHLEDELFAYDKERALEFCKQVKEFTDTVPYKIYFNLSLRVDCADEQILDALKSIGCTLIGLGLESFSLTVLNSMKKHTSPEQIERILQMIAEKGLAGQGSFIFGDPAETFETATETLDFYNNHQDIIRGGITLGFVVPFQGSPLYKYCVEKGIIKDEIEFIEKRSQEGYPFFEPMNLTRMSDSEFEKLKDRVFTAAFTTGYFSIPISSESVNGVNEIQIRCPYCNQVSVLKNINYPKRFEFQQIGCRHCNGKFRMVTPYYPAMRFIFKILGFNRINSLKKTFDRIRNVGSNERKIGIT